MFDQVTTAGLIADAVVLAIIIGFAIFGKIKGFFQMLLRLASGIVSLIVSWKLTAPVANLVNGWGFKDWLRTRIFEKIKLPEVSLNLNAEEFIEKLSLPETIANWLRKLIPTDAVTVAQGGDLEQSVSEKLASLSVNLIISIVLFILCLLLFRLLIKLFDRFDEGKVFGKVNGWLGFALGALFGILIIWIIFALMSLLGLNTSIKGFSELLTHTLLMKFLFNANPLLAIAINIKP